jgi:hypothetical protein
MKTVRELGARDKVSGFRSDSGSDRDWRDSAAALKMNNEYAEVH